MPDVNDAKAGSSPANGGQDPSGGGNHPQKTTDELLKEYKAEAERKQVLIDELRQKDADRAEAVESLQDQIKELTDKLASGEGTKQDKVDLAAAKEAIKNNPKFAPWHEAIKDATQEVVWRANYSDAMEWIGDKAESLKVDRKQFESEILEVVRGRWTELMPKQRIKLAFQEWNRNKETETKLKELEDLKAGKKTPPQGEGANGNGFGFTNLKDEFQKAKQGGNLAGVLKKVADSQQGMYDRR